MVRFEELPTEIITAIFELALENGVYKHCRWGEVFTLPKGGFSAACVLRAQLGLF